MTERAWEQGAICQLWIGGGERGEGEKPETRRLKNKIKGTLDKKNKINPVCPSPSTDVHYNTNDVWNASMSGFFSSFYTLFFP